MDAWLHGKTDRSQRGGGEGGLEEISQRIYMYICIAHGHSQQCAEGQSGNQKLGGGGK